MKRLHFLFTFFILITTLSCSSSDENETTVVDLSNLEDYTMFFTVSLESSMPNEKTETYEYEVTLFETDGNNQIIENSYTASGTIPNYLGTNASISSTSHFKEYKVIGIRVNSITENITGLYITLTQESNQNLILETNVNFTNTASVSYDFDTGTETIESN